MIDVTFVMRNMLNLVNLGYIVGAFFSALNKSLAIDVIYWCLWQGALTREMEPNASSSNGHRFIYNTSNTLSCIILKTNATIYTQNYLFSPLAFIYLILFFTLFFKLRCSLVMLEHLIGSRPKNIPPHIFVSSKLFVHMGWIKLT